MFSALLVSCLLLTACSGSSAEPGDEPAPVATEPTQDRPGKPSAPGRTISPTPAGQPNIVLVLMDDFSMDLAPTLRSAKRMTRRGASYPWSFVVDSLCCVSRASLFTGQYPHQTGVLTNTANTPNRVGPIGGWAAFRDYGNARRSFNVRLQQAGYTTGFIGKYLNQYEPVGGKLPPTPPGWTQWQAMFGSAYDGWDFQRAQTGRDGKVRLVNHPAPPASASRRAKDAAYVGTITHDLALDFIDTHGADDAPYFLKVSTFAPHSRVGPRGHYPGDPAYPAAFRDRPGGTKKHGNCGLVDCRDLTVDDLVGFGQLGPATNPRSRDGKRLKAWRPDVAPSQRHAVNTLRDRAMMSQSIDRMVLDILDAVDDNTYVILTSDNGYHLGQHGLGQGKGAPYDTDVRVPFYVVGPGVVPGERAEVISNIDLAPTFEDMAGLRPARFRSGVSLVPTFTDPDLSRRDYVIFEHTWAKSLGMDPDKFYSGGTIDDIPSYVAVRSRHGLLARFDLDNRWARTRYGWEFYDYTESTWESRNSYHRPRHAKKIRELRRVMRQFDACTDHTRNDRVPASCRRITRP
ncbi:sulfatase-like hydrolase/transferase [Nocardioides limicola]|uniref:sulfatase-like hydrolase/transferase n=1 Tax=Nocardioides limicola TaxID=2803368 RepID=UPI00193C4FCE|nr:sulfatase-like hydrolase/transferase [Nocardioides sp. DJM-14]